MKRMRRQLFACIFNALILIFTVSSVLSLLLVDGKMGVVCFRYFTIDSNLLCALSSLILIISILFGRYVPTWVNILRYIGTSAVMLTCLTVVCFLGPLMGFEEMSEGENLFLHYLTPILSLLSFLFLEEGYHCRKRIWLGVLPMLVYGCVYIAMVLIVGWWPDFYCFNGNGRWYLSLVIMILASSLISFLLYFCHNKAQK